MLERKRGKNYCDNECPHRYGAFPTTLPIVPRVAHKTASSRAVGLELARSNIQVNAIAQNYINNNTYYPDDILDNEKFLEHVKRNVPTREQSARPNETAQLAAYLAREDCSHMVGQIIPLAGGWAT